MKWDEYGIIKGITLKGMHFDEYSDIITLVAGPVNEELKLAAEKKAAEAAATESKAENAESADSKTESTGKTDSAEKAESTEKTGSSEKTESTDAKTDSAESKAEGPSTKAETSKGSEAAESGTLTARGTDYTVTLSYGADAKIPAGASLEVSEIENGTRAYKKYLAQAKAAMGLDKNQELPKEQARFFDIRIMVDGEEVQPSANVSVNITYDQPVVEADPHVETKIDASAVHFGKEGAEVVTVGDADASRVAFEAESFSIYGVIYTVDFEYIDPETGESYAYSLRGNDSINLTELLVFLGIKTEEEVEEFVATEVENVEFSDPELVRVTHSGKFLGLFGTEDWKLESLQPFNTEEMLTITLKGGGRICIVVRDLQYSTSLNDFLTDLTINGAEWDAANNQYVVKEGKKYGITMTFQEGEAAGQYQFSNDGWMTLTLPPGIKFEPTGNTFQVYVNEAGENFTINGNQLEVNGDSIRIKLNSSDPNYQKLKDLTTATFTVNVNGEFNAKEGGYTIDGKTDTDIEVSSENDVTIQKSGAVTNWNSDPNYATVKYTVTVTSNGKNKEVVIKDVISGDTITYNGDATVKKSGGSTVNWQTSTSGNGFTMTSGEMLDGEVYVIEYTAKIDKRKLNSETGAFDLGDNRNTVTWDGDHPTPFDVNHSVSTGVNKSAGTVTSNGSTRTIPWTITAYSDFGTNNQLHTITDTIKTPGLHYAGDRIHVVVYNNDVNPPTVFKDTYLNWSEVGVSDKSTATGFELDVIQKLGDNTGKKYKYVISYDTEYDASTLTQKTDVKNESHDDHDHKGEGTAGVEPNPENKMELSKTMEGAVKDVDGKITVTWHVNVTVPKVGLTAAQAVLTENLPRLEGQTFQDTYVDGSFKVISGLQGSETAVINTAESTAGQLVINFTKNGTDLGLNSSGDKRTVVLELKTLCDPDWITAADEDPNVSRTHTNQAIFNNIYAHASYTPPETRFEKQGSQSGTAENGLPKFTYSLLVGVISEELFAGNSEFVKTDGTRKYIELTDIFDERLSYISGSAKVYGGDNRFDVNGWETALSGTAVAPDSANHKVTFRLYEDQLPKNTGKLLSYYKVVYQLAVKDQATFEQLQKDAVAAETHKVTLSNTAQGFGETEFDIDYEPNVLDKRHKVEDGKLYFTITVNEDELTLSDNGVLVLTDTMTNLSVRYQDVSVVVDGNKTVETTDAEGNPVTAPYFNMKGDTITFYIPDGVKTTITYAATPRGEVAADGNIYYSNTAKLQGFEKTDSGSKKYESEASGYGTNYGVNIYKADALVNSNALDGAVFKLFEADEEDADGNIISGSPVKNSDGSDYTVTTSDGKDGNPKGTVLVMGTEDLGWNLKPEKRYYLLEVVAPEGYALDPTKYSFIISKDGYVNYTRYPVVAPDGSGKIVQPWTYHNGDVLTVKDWYKDGVLTLTKSFNGLNTTEPDDDQKAAISFQVYKWNDTKNEYELFRTIAFDQMTKDENNNYSYTIGDLAAGQYKVVEVVNDVTCKQTTYEVVDTDEGAAADNTSDNREERYTTIKISEEDVSNNTENKVNITNEYNVPSEYKIYKYGSPANIVGETDYKLAKAKFSVYATNASYEIIQDSVIESFETDSRGKYTVRMEEPKYSYDTLYAVQETEAPEGFVASDKLYYFCFLSGTTELNNVPEGTVQIPYLGVETQEVANTPKNTYIEAEKIWLNDMLEETDDDTSVQVRIRQIASYDKAGKVIEEALSGYYSATSAEPVTQQRATTFKIEKTGGSDGHWQLAKDTVDDPKLVDGKLTGLPTMTIDNHIPIYYSYEIEEVVPEGYTATYQHSKLQDGGIHAKVTNKPKSTVTTTRVKARKKWVDIDGNDVTDQMGFEDRVSLNVYRTTGVINKGKIITNSEKTYDAKKLYAVPVELVQGADRGTVSVPFVTVLPGDTIEVRVTKTETDKNWGPPQGTYYQVETWGTSGNQMTFDVVDSELVVSRIVVPTTKSISKIELNDYGEYLYDVSLVNVTAELEGRTQVLTHEEAEEIGGRPVSGAVLNLNKQGNWQDSSTDLITSDSRGNIYSYYLVEEHGDIYSAQYSVSGDTVEITNVETKLALEKIWYGANGEDDITEDKEDGEVRFTLTRDTYPMEYGSYTGEGTLSISFDHFQYGRPNWAYHDITDSNILSGSQYQNIKAGSTVEIVISTQGGDNTYPDNDVIRVNGQEVSSSWVMNPSTAAYRYSRTIYIDDIQEDCVISGLLDADPSGAAAVLVNVIQEPIDQHQLGERENIGEVVISAENASYIPAAGYEDLGISAVPGTKLWTAVLNDLPNSEYSEEYNQTVVFKYAATEQVDESDNYVAVSNSGISAAGGMITQSNRLKPGYLKIKKAVEGAVPAGKTYEIAVTDSEGNYYGADGKNYGSTPHYESFVAGDELTWNPLTPGRYNVLERNASQEGYTWTVSGTGMVNVEQGVTAESTVTNSYYKNAEYTPSITKALKFGDTDITWPDDISFDFYLSFISGEHENEQLTRSDVIMNNREATATKTKPTAQFNLEVTDPGTQQVQILPGIVFKKPGTYKFSIEEVEPAGTQDHKKNGIVYSTDKVELTVIVGEKDGESGVLEVKSKTYSIKDPASNGEAGLITNSPDYPTYAPSVTKKLTEDGQIVPATEWDEKKSFTFDLAFSSGEADNVIMPSNLEKTVTASSDNLKETFNEIAFKEEGDYTFTVTERKGTDPIVSYNTTSKNIVVTVERDDEDNNLKVTKVIVDGTEVTGEAIVGSGVTIENTIVRKKPFEFTKIWKTTGDQIEEWPADKTIAITLYSGVNTEVAAFELDENGGTTGAYTWTATENTDNTYTFKIEGLDAVDGQGNALEYYVKETTVDGYKEPEYCTKTGSTGNTGEGTGSTGEETGGTSEGTTGTGGSTTFVPKGQNAADKDRAKDKEAIINRPYDAVSLPSTGGPGTKLFYGMGIAFIAMAGIILFIKRKDMRFLRGEVVISGDED